jgi:LysM repeat protein
MKLIMNMLFGVMLLGLCSCTTMRGMKKSEAQDLKAEVYQLSNRVVALEESNQNIHSQMEALRVSNAESQATMKDAFVSAKQDLDNAMSSQGAMKHSIISEISGKMAKVITEQSKTSSAGTIGRYHTVSKGDTLSAIASAYNSNIQVIVKANNLKSANAIRIGQKIFIPE